MDKRLATVQRVPSLAAQGDWYLVQCKPKQDERAEDNLVRQGYV